MIGINKELSKQKTAHGGYSRLKSQRSSMFNDMSNHVAVSMIYKNARTARSRQENTDIGTKA